MKGFYSVTKSISIPNEEDLRLGPRQTNDIDKFIANRIKAIRNKIGFSQSKVAEMLDITFQQVQKYENCTNRVSSSRLWDFAKIFNTTIDEFFPGLSKGVAAESASTQKIPYDKEIFSLVRDFMNIKNPDLKKQILSMTKSLAKVESQSENNEQ